jgi:hypothetical protein
LVADGAGFPEICRVAANILNKQTGATEKKCFFSLWAVRLANNLWPQKIILLGNIAEGIERAVVNVVTNFLIP